MPAARARSRPPASARFEMTTAIRRREPTFLDGVDQGLEIAAPARDEDADRRMSIHAYTTPSPPARISPMRTAPGSPVPSQRVDQFASRSGAQARMRPIPMLKVRSMSASGTLPVCCSQLKIAGTCHAERSIAACVPAGSMRGRLSVIPPPVMCAMPLMRPLVTEQGPTTRRYERCGTRSASPIERPSSGITASDAEPRDSNAIRRASE